MSKSPLSLIMLPGLDGTGMVFEPLLECLPGSIEPSVVRYPLDKVLSFPEYVEFARQHVPADKPFVLLAESFSGPIGLQLLGNPPENLVGVIFVATFARYPKPFLLDLARLLPQGPLMTLFKSGLLGRFFCLGSAPGDAVKCFRKALSSVAQKILTSRLQVLAELPPPPETTFTGPCLYLQATRDRLVPERAANQLQQHLPQLQIKQLPGPHILLLARPQEGAGIIQAFMTSLTEPTCPG